ncbi:hypothetical protein BCR44DRAFT_1445904 [Catenaria anguillulae PL171]|uniref:Uncharacterized protein n=1 Tax=Catenaria anguillulae PL171 TaxID=765915 RepID=A0A1Y2H6I3_9FUNG|nr:hypothetical protein BCR44DRAFT_1445904 [Catenaria anguillulae PL171]
MINALMALHRRRLWTRTHQQRTHPHAHDSNPAAATVSAYHVHTTTASSTPAPHRTAPHCTAGRPAHGYAATLNWRVIHAESRCPHAKFANDLKYSSATVHQITTVIGKP